METSATATLAPESFAFKTSDEIQESIDPRAYLSSTPHPDELTKKLSTLVQKDSGHPQYDISKEEKGATPGSDETFYVEFEEGDKTNPANYTNREKWIITAITCFDTLVSCATVSTYTPGISAMSRDLHITYLQAITGVSVYTLGFGLAPLFTAPLSEEFGRKPIYMGSALILVITGFMIGFAKNVQTVLVARLFQGAAASTGGTMTGGTVADIWSPNDRGIPMAIYTLSVMTGFGSGAIVGGWMEMNPHLGWRWIQWIQIMVCAICVILLLFKKETRSGVLLTRLAKRIRKETGDNRYRARVEDERPSLLRLIVISCTRPIYLAVTEPIVTAFSLWAGFAWGVTYSFLSIISLVFQDVHHFSIGLANTAFVSVVIGSFLGLIANFYQNTLYRRNVAKRGPEARLYMACVAGIMLPAGLFIFAWTTLPHLHWIGINIGIAVFMWAMYIIFQTVFSYLSDCYGTWASSASAGQSLARNLMATAFPLFSRQMFQGLSYKWAGTIFACIAALMAPIPFVLFFWGPAIRKRSKVASRLVLT